MLAFLKTRAGRGTIVAVATVVVVTLIIWWTASTISSINAERQQELRRQGYDLIGDYGQAVEYATMTIRTSDGRPVKVIVVADDNGLHPEYGAYVLCKVTPREGTLEPGPNSCISPP